MAHWGLIAGVFTAAVTAVSAAASEAGDAARGKAYALQNCAQCHAVDPSAGPPSGMGAAPFSVIANTPGMTATALAVWLQTTHRDMPNFIIPPEDRDDLIAFVLSLRERSPR